MALYIRDNRTADLADQLSRLTGSSKTDAVRAAIEDAIEKQQSAPTLPDIIRSLQQRVAEAGFRCRSNGPRGR